MSGGDANVEYQNQHSHDGGAYDDGSVSHLQRHSPELSAATNVHISGARERYIDVLKLYLNDVDNRAG
jgi:hypothetical protein